MNFRNIFLTAVLLLLGFNMAAQVRHDFDLKLKRKDFSTTQKEGLVEAWEHIKAGDAFFEAGVGTYDLAREQYLAAHQYNPDNNILNFRIGICYLYTDDKYEALRYLRAAYDKAPNLHPEMHYYLGRAYHLVLEFDKAREHYRSQREIYVSTGNVEGVMKVDKRLMECENGKKLVEEPRRVIISNLGDSVNSPADDYNAFFAAHDSVLYFTSRRYESKKDKRNPYDNKFYEDIYVSYLTDAGWTGARPFAKKLNDRKSNDALAGISHDENTIYVYKGESNGGDIYYSEFNPKKSSWKSPKSMPSKIRSKQTESSVFQTVTGDTLYFISANEEMTKGGKDIFYTVKNEKGKWQEPKNLGSLLNTPYDEEGVFLNPAGNEIWFSSKGHNSMGGFDVFHSYKQDDGTWSDPENLGYPVNTPDDELFFKLASNQKAAYYSTIRESVVGGKDIYKLIFLGAEKELMLHKEDALIAGIVDTVKTGFFDLPQAVHIDSFYFLTGKVLDKKTGNPVFAKLDFIDIDASKPAVTTVTNDSGVYTVKFTEPKNYGVEVIAKDYLFFLDVVDLTSAGTDAPKYKDFLVERLEVGAKVVLENIYFETNKANLKPDSYTQLNQVVSFLENNETVRLEISGHTDNVGSMRYNSKLSEDRAQAVVDYLVAQGIGAGRLESKGYAYTQPIAPNDTPEGREKNRRVEFKILSK